MWMPPLSPGDDNMWCSGLCGMHVKEQPDGGGGAA
jgi:hypothetical protein